MPLSTCRSGGAPPKPVALWQMRQFRPGRCEAGWAGAVGAARTGAMGAHYAASKAGIIAMTKSFATSLGPSGATANAIAPGPTKTDDPVRWAPATVEALQKQIQ